MIKETALIGVPIAVGATVVINPHAAIGAAIGCCFFLAVPWGSVKLEWWRRLLLSIFSYGAGYAAGAFFYGDGEENGSMLCAIGVSAIVAVAMSAFRNTTERTIGGDGPLPQWVKDILDRVPFLNRRDP